MQLGWAWRGGVVLLYWPPELRSWLTLVRAALVCSAFASSCRNDCDLLHECEITRERERVCCLDCLGLLKRFEAVWCVLFCTACVRDFADAVMGVVIAQFSHNSRSCGVVLALFTHLGRPFPHYARTWGGILALFSH